MTDENDDEKEPLSSSKVSGQPFELTSSRQAGEGSDTSFLDAIGDKSPLPFEDLVAPTPLRSAPPMQARWLALCSTLLAGLLGGLVGYGIGDLMGRTSTWAAIGGAIGAIIAAGGVGIIANLTLRAMNEWKSVDHPEQESD